MGADWPNDEAVTNTKINANTKILRGANVGSTPIDPFLSPDATCKTTVYRRCTSRRRNGDTALIFVRFYPFDKGQTEKPATNARSSFRTLAQEPLMDFAFEQCRPESTRARRLRQSVNRWRLPSQHSPVRPCSRLQTPHQEMILGSRRGS